ncbi:MAG: hypothetical protein HUU10_03610 [Bacteroidetes bacterium]|nr:hypothetical protein [Bacteroidota bacterium]
MFLLLELLLFLLTQVELTHSWDVYDFNEAYVKNILCIKYCDENKIILEHFVVIKRRFVFFKSDILIKDGDAFKGLSYEMEYSSSNDTIMILNKSKTYFISKKIPKSCVSREYSHNKVNNLYYLQIQIDNEIMSKKILDNYDPNHQSIYNYYSGVEIDSAIVKLSPEEFVQFLLSRKKQ